MGIPVARQDTVMASLFLSLPSSVLTDRIATLTTGWSAIGAASYLAYPAICMQRAGAIAARPALGVFQVAPEAARLTLTEELELVISGRQVRVPHCAERVLTYPALGDRLVAQARLIGVFLRDGSGQGVVKSLSTRPRRIRRAGADLMLAHDDRLRPYPDVTVELTELIALAKRLVWQPAPEPPEQLPPLAECAELLPDWGEERLAAAWERYRLLRLKALQHAALALLKRCQPCDALVAALSAVRPSHSAKARAAWSYTWRPAAAAPRAGTRPLARRHGTAVVQAAQASRKRRRFQWAPVRYRYHHRRHLVRS